MRVDVTGDHQLAARVDDPAAALPISRRRWMGFAASAMVVAITRRAWALGPEAGAAMTVYRSPTCGCCNKWIAIMRKAGHTITERDMDDVTPVKRERGIPEQLYSCHTAVAGAYLFEGHVPPDLVERVLREKPAFLGLAAPGMPQSAPGMDIGHERYEVLSFTKAGKTAVYAVRS